MMARDLKRQLGAMEDSEGCERRPGTVGDGEGQRGAARGSEGQRGTARVMSHDAVMIRWEVHGINLG